MQQGEQTCNIRQCWELLVNNVASICTQPYSQFFFNFISPSLESYSLTGTIINYVSDSTVWIGVNISKLHLLSVFLLYFYKFKPFIFPFVSFFKKSVYGPVKLFASDGVWVLSGVISAMDSKSEESERFHFLRLHLWLRRSRGNKPITMHISVAQPGEGSRGSRTLLCAMKLAIISPKQEKIQKGITSYICHYFNDNQQEDCKTTLLIKFKWILVEGH